jgi:hypothetical protein
MAEDTEERGLRRAASALTEGMEAGGLLVHAESRGRGRYRNEEDFEVFIKTRGEGDAHLLFLKLYYGRPPRYLPWAELYGIASTEGAEGGAGFFGTGVENALLGLLAGAIGPGGDLYVEYYGDRETREALERSVPAAATRLGGVLFRLGFTWFKDWYFPEGGQKLQAERPLDEEARARHVADIRRELRAFVGERSGEPRLSGALKRARETLGELG